MNVFMSKRGFTFIELIVVIAILGILSAIALSVLNPLEQFKKSMDIQRKNDIAQIQRAVEAYYQDFGKYPSNNTNYEMVVMVSGVQTSLSWGSSWSPYMDVVPKDPTSSKKYIYSASSDQQSYWLYVSLDRGAKDPQACNTDGTACPNVPNNGLVTCGLATDYCNFGASSPNQSP